MLHNSIVLSLAVKPEDETSFTKAEYWARRLNLPVVGLLQSEQNNYDFLLLVSQAGLALQEIKNKHSKPLFIDFKQGALAYRRKYGGAELISRAVGVKKNKQLKVLDATAGLGRDAFVLASLGCKVTMLERSPIVAALLEDALARAEINNMELLVTDAASYLANLSSTNDVDVIYLDPMYPHRTKSALVKKEMRVLRALVGDDDDIVELLSAALAKAQNRVVLKRPILAPAAIDRKPDIVFSGNNSRFDVYL